jgi:hypothetical protein
MYIYALPALLFGVTIKAAVSAQVQTALVWVESGRAAVSHHVYAKTHDNREPIDWIRSWQFYAKHKHTQHTQK